MSSDSTNKEGNSLLATATLISLATDPALHLDEFVQQFHELSQFAGASEFPNGIATFFLAYTPDRLETLERDGLLVDNSGLPIIVPDLPQKPKRLSVAHARNPLRVAVFKEKERIFKVFQYACAQLKAKMLTCLGTTITARLRTLPGGLTVQTVSSILLFLDESYGEMSSAQITALVAKLDSPCRTNDDFVVWSTDFTLVVQQLERNGEIPSPQTQLDKLEKGINHLPDIMSSVIDYKKLNRRRALRTLTAEIKYIIDNTDLGPTIGELGYVGATTGITPAAPITPPPPFGDQLILQALVAGFAGLTAQLAAPGRDSGGRGRGGQGGRTTSGTGRGGRGAGRGHPPARHYCFEHGWDLEHIGKGCKAMDNSDYTQAMRDATAPCVLDGWNGSTNIKGRRVA